MKKSIWLLSLLLTVALYSGCGEKDDPASNNSATRSAYPSPSGTPTPTPTTPPVNYNAVNNNSTVNHGPQPPAPPPSTPPPTPTPEKPHGPWVMCKCYDPEGKKLLWKRKLRESECNRLCPIPLDRPDEP